MKIDRVMTTTKDTIRIFNFDQNNGTTEMNPNLMDWLRAKPIDLWTNERAEDDSQETG